VQTREIKPKILYYGTPVALVSTENDDGTFNLAPMSSSWALGYRVVLGFGMSGQTFHNLELRPQLTVNFPSPNLVDAVERLAPLTGRNPIPSSKALLYRTERNKFEAAQLTAVRSEDVRPPRVAECPLQLEAIAEHVYRIDEEDAAIVQTRVLRVFAHEEIVEGESHIDVGTWHPLLYVYRHYFGRGQHLGRTFKAET
jgi:flavin reductase (DIM6/NTAB) family NADH-FMN oxidoreductase RutF